MATHVVLKDNVKKFVFPKLFIKKPPVAFYFCLQNAQEIAELHIAVSFISLLLE